MNISIFGRALLNLYKYLEPMTVSIDKLIATKTENFSVSMGENMESLSNEIINLTERKVSLINIKVLIDKAIARLSKGNKKMIILRYIDNMSINDLSELLGISQRTYFRKINSAFAAFCNMLAFENTLNKDLLSKYLRERWFANFVDYFDEGSKKTDCSKLLVCDHLFRQVKEVC